MKNIHFYTVQKSALIGGAGLRDISLGIPFFHQQLNTKWSQTSKIYHYHNLIHQWERLPKMNRGIHFLFGITCSKVTSEIPCEKGKWMKVLERGLNPIWQLVCCWFTVSSTLQEWCEKSRRDVLGLLKNALGFSQNSSDVSEYRTVSIRKTDGIKSNPLIWKDTFWV